MLSAGNILPAPIKRVGTAVHSALRRVLDLALPPLCAACREPVEGRGLCPACWSKPVVHHATLLRAARHALRL